LIPHPDESFSGGFEGPEKLLEMWFAENSSDVGLGLKAISRQDWEDMLTQVGCKVLSVVKSASVDAYLLSYHSPFHVSDGCSESSLFVFPHKLILKTCGTTTLLEGIPPILELAQKAGFVYQDVYRVFYSRKSFMFPERQRSPHGSWGEEVHRLNSFFSIFPQNHRVLIADNGEAYVVGSLIGDHWYLFLTGPLNLQSPMPFHRSNLQDETLEILMTNLDPVNAEKFHLDSSKEEGHAHGSVIAKECGLMDIFPVDRHCGGRLDGYAFAPCGFSANAVIATPQSRQFPESETPGYYFTVHVTPEQGYSYASFETNVPADMFPGRGTRQIVSGVVDGFKPGRMCITKFISHGNKSESDAESEFGRDSGFVDDFHAVREKKWDWRVEGYRRCEKIVYEFDGYDLVFASYIRNE
jgi:S-adenosylmethionine decarboxylase